MIIGEPDPKDRHRHLQPVIDALSAAGNETWESWTRHAHGPDSFLFRYPLDLGRLHRAFIFPEFIYVGPDTTGRPIVACSRSDSMIYGMGGPYGPASDPWRAAGDLRRRVLRSRRGGTQ